MNPYRITEPTCISFSGGRTSAYMLWKILEAHDMSLPKEAIICFANTGKEEEATLRFVEDCATHWCVRITWLEYIMEDPRYTVVDHATASRHGEPFEAIIAHRGGYLPNRVARYCSSEMKTRTMHRHLKSIGWTDWDTFIGIRADEPRRVAKFRANPRPEFKGEEVHMPLALDNVTAKDVGKFWNEQPFDLRLPNINGKTMHGNCDLCYLKPASQVLSLITEKPERATWWARQEAKAEQVAASASRFRDDRPSYAAMLKFSTQQADMFDANEEGISCFCGD